MTTRIWIEPVKRPMDATGTPTAILYSGLTLADLMARSSVIGRTTRSLKPAGCSCRVAFSAFETGKVGIPYPCMTGDIASTAGPIVHEPDDDVVRFARWRLFDQNAVSRSAVPAPATFIG